MDIKILRRSLAVIMAAVALLLFCMLAAGEISKEKNTADELYRLTVLNGEVVLYRGNELIDTYEGVYPENLPADDRRALENGILFETKGQAERAVEDYDG